MTDDPYEYQKNITLIQIYCAVGLTISGFLLAVGFGFAMQGRTYLDQVAAQGFNNESLLIKGFDLLGNGAYYLLGGLVGVVATMVISTYFVRKAHSHQPTSH